MNFNTATRDVEGRPSFARRHKIITTLISIPAFVMVLGITIALGVGFAQGVHAKTGQITIQRTDSEYQDCTAFANARGFATDVCEPLLPTSTIAQTNCREELKNNEFPADCAPYLKP